MKTAMSHRYGDVVLRRGFFFLLILTLFLFGIFALGHYAWFAGAAAIVSGFILFPETERCERYGIRVTVQRWRMAAIIATVTGIAFVGSPLMSRSGAGWEREGAIIGVSLFFGAAYAAYRSMHVR